MGRKKKEAVVTPTDAPGVLSVASKGAAQKKAKKVKEECSVTCEGSVITCKGSDVYVREMTPEQLKKAGIKQVTGTLGKPCVEPVVLKFKSPAASHAFYDATFEEEEEANESIVSGSKTDWFTDQFNP